MKQPWYWPIIGEKFAPANCTLQDLKALPERDRRIRFYMLSIALRLTPLIDRLRTGSADQVSDDLDTVLAQLALITGEKSTAQDIYKKYLGGAHAISTHKAIVAIFKKARPEFDNPMANDPDSIPRYLRSRQTDDIYALVEVIKKEMARSKPGGKKKILDYLPGNNAADIVAFAKIVKKAMGRISSENAALNYLRSNNVEEIAAFVKTKLESGPKPQEPTVEGNEAHWLSPSRAGGIDRVARSGSEIHFIERKRTQKSAIDINMVTGLINYCDVCRPGMEVMGFTLKPTLVTNASVPRSVAAFAFDRGVDVIQCSSAELENSGAPIPHS